MPFRFGRKSESDGGGDSSAPVTTVQLDPTNGVPAAVAALDQFRTGDWRSLESAHGASQDWDTRGVVTNALGALDPDEEWIRQQPGSAFAHVVYAAQLRRIAWQIRGGGKANSVASSAWSDFFSTLRAAEQALWVAAELQPDDPDPWAQLIWTGMGLQVPIEETLRRFASMQERDAGYIYGWLAVTSAVAQKWGGSHALMFDVAREGLQQLPEGSLGRVGIVRAHEERRLYLANWEDDVEGARKYFQRPEVATELAEAASASVLSDDHRVSSSTRLAQSWFAYALALVGDAVPAERLRAASLFLALGTDGLPNQPWETRYGARGAEQYARIRALCYRAAAIDNPNELHP